jgi:hypothetical protein
MQQWISEETITEIESAAITLQGLWLTLNSANSFRGGSFGVSVFLLYLLSCCWYLSHTG